ncbi:MAG TPA: hypothetical protein VIH57_21410 [Bacteroidales bacterium]
MKKILILLILCPSFFACSRTKQPAGNQHQETPKILQNDKRDVSFSKRNYDDLVNELYQDQVTKNQNLEEIENLIEANNAEKDEILGKYATFDKKSEGYYSLANTQSLEILDTALRAKILLLIKASRNKYNDGTSNLEAIIKRIEIKSASIQDYHTALKIIVTLPVIENYQRDYLPKDSIYKGFSKQQDQIISKMDKIVKK